MGRRRLGIEIETRALLRPFSISRGVRTEVAIVRVRLSQDGCEGRGAATGVTYRGESVETMLREIENRRSLIEQGAGREEINALLPAGGARAALDAALWELEAALAGTSVADLLGISPRPLASAFTIVLDDPAAMAEQAQTEAWRPLLKVKLGLDDGREAERIRAVRQAAPDAALVADANAGWSPETLGAMLPLLEECAYRLIEQPLPIGSEALLPLATAPLHLCLDESFDTSADLDRLPGGVTHVNIKLDKCGGLTEALTIRDRAEALGLGIFVGCMVGPSEAIAPAHLLAQRADYVDLDGPFWVEGEADKARLNKGGLMLPIAPEVWGRGERDA
ncbi:MAG: dipeptide epimerase [Erythrobacter sp.]|jgi:L-alanine-DL-glutamate epimerase-like enolase superfamily enzyme|nr:dipeptide epimerase [Erythrobacter sp.]